jgi:excisionase family DNA binding protein
METTQAALAELSAIEAILRERGDTALADRVTTARNSVAPRDGSITLELMTTGEAAKLLGIRSVNTIKRWAADGILVGFRRGGRVLVSRESVERLRDTEPIAEERDFEQRLDAALAPFDFSDMDSPRSNAMWIGRKPWEAKPEPQNVSATS